MSVRKRNKKPGYDYVLNILCYIWLKQPMFERSMVCAWYPCLSETAGGACVPTNGPGRRTSTEMQTRNHLLKYSSAVCHVTTDDRVPFELECCRIALRSKLVEFAREIAGCIAFCPQLNEHATAATLLHHGSVSLLRIPDAGSDSLASYSLNSEDPTCWSGRQS